MQNARARLFAALLPSLFVALIGFSDGCSGGGSPTDCEEGASGCACYADNTYNVGLDCVSGACVDTDAPGDGGPGADVGADAEPPPPAPDCVELLPLRLRKSDPSAVAMLFTAEDCATGEVYAHFDETAFAIAEDGRGLSSEAAPRILPSKGLRVYVTLMLDMSGSTAPNLVELQAGARSFVDQILVEQALENVFIGLQVFDGSPSPFEIQSPIRDPARLRSKIDGLRNFEAPDPGSANLHGATRQGDQSLQIHQQRVMDLNYQGVVTTGYLVLFTAGREEAVGA